MKCLAKSRAEVGLWMETRAVPEIGPEDVLIRIKKTGICGTDIHIWNWDDWAARTVPVGLVTGHEFAGEIVAKGALVEGLAIGQRCSGEGHLIGKQSRQSRAGKFHLDPATRGIGVNEQGAFAEYLRLPAFNVVPLPDTIDDEIGAILDPLGNAVHTALSFDLVGEDVLITGAGPIGIMAAAVARHVGARHVVITDVNPARLALAAERKLTLEDIDMGDVSKAELGAAGEAVFALEGPAVVGPFQSDLGPALFRMNAVLSAQETTFDEARDTLASEMQTDAARRAIADKVEAVDDLLAGGAAIEDVAKEQGLTLSTTDYAEGADDNAEIAGYPAFREAAGKIGEGDFPEAILLDDGGLVVLRLDAIVPPTPQPLDAVRDKVTEAWHADALAKALADYATTAKAAVEGGASLGAYGIVEVTSNIDRQGFVEGAPETLLPAVFEMATGDLRVIEAPGFTALVQLDSIAPAVTEGEDATALRDSIKVQAAQAIAQDAFSLYTQALTTEAGITLDQAAINAVHAQFQ